jgi:hypothetical protein
MIRNRFIIHCSVCFASTVPDAQAITVPFPSTAIMTVMLGRRGQGVGPIYCSPVHRSYKTCTMP